MLSSATTYECVICYSVNHTSRYQCKNCGTIPRMYSMLNHPAKRNTEPVDSLGMLQFIPVIRAYGAESIERWHNVKIRLQTLSQAEADNIYGIEDGDK